MSGQPALPPIRFDAVQLARLFPAFLRLDRHLRIVAFGPVIARELPLVAAGDPFDLHFDAGVHDPGAMSMAGSTLTIHGRGLERAATFVGSVVEIVDGSLLALNFVPDHADIAESRSHIDDYAPSDPVVPVLLLASVQKALLEETNTIATDLLNEQQRNVRLFEHVRRVAGGLAHDFNNVLSIIRLNVGRLRDAESTAARARMVDIVLEAVDRGAEATQSFMTMSQQDHGAPSLLSPDEVIAANRALLAAVAGREVDLSFEAGASGLRGMFSKPGLLNSLFHVIVVARDGMGHGRIAISTRPRKVTTHGIEGHQLAPGTYVEIAIRTSSRSVAADIVDRRVAGVYATIPDGGVNRYGSVQVFARQMLGGAWIDKARGAGSVVRIVLPVQNENAEHPPSAAEDQNEDGGPLPPRVLIVEDEPYALEALTEILAEDFRVTPAASARDALAILAGHPHDVLLSDVVMPDMTGIELAREIRDTHPDMRIVLMSGYVPREDELAADWAFIRKPIATDQLARLLHAPDA